MFDVEKWLQERRERWAKIVAMGDQAEIREPQEIMGMSDEEFAQWEKGDNGADAGEGEGEE